jgi:hypothetical protein
MAFWHEIKWAWCVPANQHIGVQLQDAIKPRQPEWRKSLLPEVVAWSQRLRKLNELASPSAAGVQERLAAFWVEGLAADVQCCKREVHAVTSDRLT